jgi:hypothetical protein
MRNFDFAALAIVVAIALTPSIGISTAEAHGGGAGAGGVGGDGNGMRVFHAGGIRSEGFHDLRLASGRGFRDVGFEFDGFFDGYYPGYYGYGACYVTIYDPTYCY